MTIEELKKAYEESSQGDWMIFMANDEKQDRVTLFGPKHFTDNRLSLKDARFIALAHMYMPKLLAIAEAAKSHIENCEDAGISDGSLQEALQHLLGGEA